MAFGLNQVLYAGMLKWTRLDYRMGLGVVLILIAIMTYVVARSWVFICKRTGEDSETATH